MAYGGDTTIYAVIHKPLSRTQGMESLNQNLASINFWYLKWQMRLNSKKTKSMVVSRSLTIALGYSDLTLGGAELEKVKSLCILGVTLDSMLTLETQLLKVVAEASKSLEFVRRSR